MKKFLYVFSLFLLLFGSFLAGSWHKQREASKVNPPGLKSSTVNTDVGSDTISDTDTSSLPSGSVKISPQKRQAIGVQIGSVEKKSVTHTLRVQGRVTVDENRLYRIIASADGWVRELGQNSAGSFVKKDQILASYYAQNLVAAVQTYVFALQTNAQAQSGDATIGYQRGTTVLSLQVALDSLRSLGMSDLQIEEIRKTRIAPTEIRIYSPINGFVIARNVSPGQRFDKGTEMYRIADLTRVWLYADIYENEGRYMRAGAIAKLYHPQLGKQYSARVSDVLPLFDATTRTLKVRLEVDNPGFLLRPDMFVDVELPINLPPAISVPADAVLDSGLKKTVFVNLGNGSFEPREVETGWRLGNRVEITKGLKPGERIVISGNFMIDSESRLEMAAQGMYATLGKDPVCGEDVSINKAEKAGRKSAYQGKVYYFSSEECKKQFDKNPSQYGKK